MIVVSWWTIIRIIRRWGRARIHIIRNNNIIPQGRKLRQEVMLCQVQHRCVAFARIGFSVRIFCKNRSDLERTWRSYREGLPVVHLRCKVRRADTQTTVPSRVSSASCSRLDRGSATQTDVASLVCGSERHSALCDKLWHSPNHQGTFRSRPATACSFCLSTSALFHPKLLCQTLLPYLNRAH